MCYILKNIKTHLVVGWLMTYALIRMIRRYHSWYIHELSQGYESWKTAIHLIFYLFKLSLGMSYYQEGHELLQFSQDVILNFFLQNQSIGGSNEPPDEHSPAPAASQWPPSWFRVFYGICSTDLYLLDLCLFNLLDLCLLNVTLMVSMLDLCYLWYSCYVPWDICAIMRYLWWMCRIYAILNVWNVYMLYFWWMWLLHKKQKK